MPEHKYGPRRPMAESTEELLKDQAPPGKVTDYSTDHILKRIKALNPGLPKSEMMWSPDQREGVALTLLPTQYLSQGKEYKPGDMLTTHPSLENAMIRMNILTRLKNDKLVKPRTGTYFNDVMKPVYGDKAETELGKALQYAKDHNTTYSMQYAKTPYVDLDSDVLNYPVQTYGDSVYSLQYSPTKATVVGGRFLNKTPDTLPSSDELYNTAMSVGSEPYAGKMIERLGLNGMMPLRPGLGPMPSSKQELDWHEKSHAATLGPLYARYGAAYPEENPLVNAMTEAGAPPLSDRILKVYPEQDPTETVPPLAALQHWWYKQTGHRFETSDELQNVLKKMDALPAEQYKALYDGMPFDAKRFMNYRDYIRARQSIPRASDSLPGSPDVWENQYPTDRLRYLRMNLKDRLEHKKYSDPLKAFDKWMSNQIPAVTYNNRNTGYRQV